MSTRRRSMAGVGRGVDAFFPEEATTEQSQHADIQTYKQDDTDGEPEEALERATFYIRPNQHEILEDLRKELRRKKVKTNKSELVRKAIDLLAEQDPTRLAELLTNK
ncbi:MAG: hypothetical protein M3380_01190 [Chloroflexota bacterium]|nr:hypothetical protein [Chloroflexota bacterium]